MPWRSGLVVFLRQSPRILEQWVVRSNPVVAYMVKKLVDVDVDIDDVDVYVDVDDVDVDDVDVDGAKKPFQVFRPRCTKFCEQHDFQ
jgi:hypothetical protein